MGRIRGSNRVEAMADAAYAIQPEIDGVLLNWGRWAGGRKGGCASSSTGMWRFASRGTRAAPTMTVVPVDNDQARLVESIVCSPGFSQKFNALLKAHYVVNAYPSRTCEAVGVSPHAYAEWVWRATVYFAERYRDQASAAL